MAVQGLGRLALHPGHRHARDCDRLAPAITIGIVANPPDFILRWAAYATGAVACITLEIGQRAQLNVTLEVGATTERMDVVADAPVISTESSSTGKVIDHQTITQMPLNGRLNITGLLALAPGVQNAGNQDGLPGGIEPDAGGVTSTQGVAFTLDGSSNQSSWLERGFAEFPPLDGIQEFKVLTSLAPAEYGKAVQVSVVSKSGGN